MRPYSYTKNTRVVFSLFSYQPLLFVSACVSAYVCVLFIGCDSDSRPPSDRSPEVSMDLSVGDVGSPDDESDVGRLDMTRGGAADMSSDMDAGVDADLEPDMTPPAPPPWDPPMPIDVLKKASWHYPRQG